MYSSRGYPCLAGPSPTTPRLPLPRPAPPDGPRRWSRTIDVLARGYPCLALPRCASPSPASPNHAAHGLSSAHASGIEPLYAIAWVSLPRPAPPNPARPCRAKPCPSARADGVEPPQSVARVTLPRPAMPRQAKPCLALPCPARNLTSSPPSPAADRATGGPSSRAAIPPRTTPSDRRDACAPLQREGRPLRCRECARLSRGTP